jgi:hypothetical protein
MPKVCCHIGRPALLSAEVVSCDTPRTRQAQATYAEAGSILSLHGHLHDHIDQRGRKHLAAGSSNI